MVSRFAHIVVDCHDPSPPRVTPRPDLRSFRMKGLSFSIPLMAHELSSVDLIKEIPELAVPVVIFLGRHDHTAPTELAEEFCESLKAPHKHVVWFEDSAHTGRAAASTGRRLDRGGGGAPPVARRP